VVPSLFSLVVFPVDLFFSRSSISQKNDLPTSLGLFDNQKAPETQKKCKNEEICFTVLKPDERGLFRKSPESMANKCMSI
jgi:hypothetical protein